MAQATNKTRFQAVIEAAVDGIVLIDARGTVRLVFTPACDKLFGLQRCRDRRPERRPLMPPPYQPVPQAQGRRLWTEPNPQGGSGTIFGFTLPGTATAGSAP